MKKLNLSKLIRKEERLPNIAHCSSCNKKFPVTECGKEIDGDWETGYYDVHICPECPDGGEIDDYSYSEEKQ